MGGRRARRRWRCGDGKDGDGEEPGAGSGAGAFTGGGSGSFLGASRLGPSGLRRLPSGRYSRPKRSLRCDPRRLLARRADPRCVAVR